MNLEAYIYISTFIEWCLLVGVSIPKLPFNSGNCGNLFRYRYWPRQSSPKQLYSQNRRISQEGRDECHSNRWKLWSHLPCCLNSQLHPESPWSFSIAFWCYGWQRQFLHVPFPACFLLWHNWSYYLKQIWTKPSVSIKLGRVSCFRIAPRVTVKFQHSFLVLWVAETVSSCSFSSVLSFVAQLVLLPETDLNKAIGINPAR